MSKNLEAKKKYNASEHASTIVVIIGLAINAGSSFTFFASMGSVQPINLARITVQSKLTDTTAATGTDALSNSITRMKLTIARMKIGRAHV